jgi:hypothetical protein
LESQPWIVLIPPAGSFRPLLKFIPATSTIALSLVQSRHVQPIYIHFINEDSAKQGATNPLIRSCYNICICLMIVICSSVSARVRISNLFLT